MTSPVVICGAPHVTEPPLMQHTTYNCNQSPTFISLFIPGFISILSNIPILYISRSRSSWLDITASMAANTRYQPAPQRDSFEEAQYAQAPPSYEATAEAPRSEDDNVPDDFKVCFYISWYWVSSMLMDQSLAEPLQRARCPSGCSLFGRCILSCKRFTILRSRCFC